MRTLVIVTNVSLVWVWLAVPVPPATATVEPQSPQKAAAPAGTPAPSPDALDRLLAPIALYPDALLGQMLLCAANPGKIGALSEWLRSHDSLKGTQLQEAARAAGFDESFAGIALFPQVVNTMAEQLDGTTKVGAAFASDKSAVFASLQRLRAKARDAGKLKAPHSRMSQPAPPPTGSR
jgi:hypothetical protein